MKRRLVPVLLILATLTAIGVNAAWASHTPPQVLGRRAVTYTSYPNDPTPTSKWTSSSQGEFIDAVADNGIRDSLRGRGADLETFGIIRFREDYVRLQVLTGEGWQTRLARETDVVREQARAYAVIHTPSGLVCRTDPTLTDTYRVVHSVLFRRSDNVVGRRTLTSDTFTARLLASDPRCPETPPPPPPPPPPPTDPANLEIATADSPDPVQHGQPVTINVAASNIGDATAAGSVLLIDTDDRLGPLTVTAPAGVTCTLVDLAPDPATPGVDDEAVRCVLGDLTGSETNTIRIVADAGIPGAYETVAVLTSTSAGVAGEDDTEATTVVASADLALGKAAAPTPDPNDAANRYRFVFQVGNAGPDTATGVTITDPWPAHLADPVNVAGDTGDCTFDDTADTLTCAAGEVTVGGAGETFIVEATVLADGTNTATVRATTADPDPEDNTDSATVNL